MARLILLLLLASPAAAAPKVVVRFPASRSAAPLDGRLMLLLSDDPSGEPRNQIDIGAKTQLAFGFDVEGWAPGTARAFRGERGYPLRALKDVPKGKYRVQALLNRYETFHLGDGRTLKLPPDKGEGQHWNLKPGNLYSVPKEIDWSGSGTLELTLDQEIPPIEDFAKQETKYVKHVRIKSERLSAFWGRDVELGAWVLLPEGYDAHPEARYPLVINHGHFPSKVEGWRETPPDPNLKPEYSDRFQLEGYNRIEQQAAYALFQAWTGPKFPRVLLVQLQHPTPFYDDSYAVNSANNGPYGDAIELELIPEIERRFRALGAGWARFLYGGSTGGWESMAVQLFYPEHYNGAWVACPDPLDFHHYTVVDIYADTNAYVGRSRWKRTPRPGHRNFLGHLSATLQETVDYELALGSKGRSGEQWDAWESVYSPVGPDGYPARLWDRDSGAIDAEVAKRWAPFDLLEQLKSNWSTLAPKLKGKLRIYVGDMDNYYLNDAVYTVEAYLKAASPQIEAVVDYGDRAEHCWNGDHTRPNAESRLRYPQLVLPWVVERALATAPPGADVTSWRY
jgi:hypothetical protein